jgi:hypothetical protein
VSFGGFNSYSFRSLLFPQIVNGCKEGNDEFEELYKQGMAQQRSTIDKCIQEGEPYAPKEDYQKTLEEFSNERNFTIPCKMNSVVFKEEVCDERNKGKSAAEIAGSPNINLSESQIEKIFEKCKQGDDFLSASQISDICDLKSMCETTQDIVESLGVSEDKVEKLSCSGLEDIDCVIL